MKKKRPIVAVATLSLLITLGVAAPARAHYDPWTTHSHCNSTGCYRSCSFWDSLWGCRNVYYIIW